MHSAREIPSPQELPYHAQNKVGTTIKAQDNVKIRSIHSQIYNLLLPYSLRSQTLGVSGYMQIETLKTVCLHR